EQERAATKVRNLRHVVVICGCSPLEISRGVQALGIDCGVESSAAGGEVRGGQSLHGWRDKRRQDEAVLATSRNARNNIAQPGRNLDLAGESGAPGDHRAVVLKRQVMGAASSDGDDIVHP